MEIRDWIKAIGARLALIFVVAGLAALLAATLALFQPQTYRATATVVLPDLPAAGPLTAVVAQRVANFQGAVTSDGVLDAVAQETGVPRSQLAAVTSVRSGQSSVMEVRFVGRDIDAAREVVEFASREALRLLAAADVAIAQAGADAAEAQYDEATTAYQQRSEETGIVFADATLESLERRFIDIDRKLSATSDPAKIEDYTRELDDLAARLDEAQSVQTLRANADAQLASWNLALGGLAQQQAKLDAVLEIRVGEVVGISKFGAILKQAAYAGLFGAALAVGYVVIVELLRSGGGPTRPSLPRPARQRSRAGAF